MTTSLRFEWTLVIFLELYSYFGYPMMSKLSMFLKLKFVINTLLKVTFLKQVCIFFKGEIASDEFCRTLTNTTIIIIL
jgi:hypothetical protein